MEQLLYLDLVQQVEEMFEDIVEVVYIDTVGDTIAEDTEMNTVAEDTEVEIVVVEEDTEVEMDFSITNL
jgi:hypothetical protein